MEAILEFERPIAELESKIRELRRLSDNDDVNIVDEIIKLETKLDQLLRSTYGKLDAWQKTQVARHPRRPHLQSYIQGLFTDFTPLAGDRNYAEDNAILGGMARFEGRPVMILGHEKGEDTETRVKHNFGMARPEGYRKAVRLIKLADKFDLPVITFVDTPGAYPGVGAEERGQAEAIARSTQACLAARVPVICFIVGEGGSGGAVALATGNRVMMLEHAIYSVISPEGCASILWRSAEMSQAKDAAVALKLTAQDLKSFNVIDDIVEEPLGGAHRDKAMIVERVGQAIRSALDELSSLDHEELRQDRRRKFLAFGSAGLS